MASPGGPSFGGKGGSHGYHHFYEIALARFRHLPGLRLLEIGVDQGESLLLWLQYFSSLAPDGVQGLECAGPGCSHVGVRGKIADACRHREILGCERVRVFFGDQADEEFLRHVVANGAGLRPEDTRHDWSRGGWDLVIDDGGHIPRDQLTSFCALFPFVRPGGLYVIEDVETSYWDGPGAVAYGRPFPGAGLGKQAPGNFVEAMKQLVDVINRGWFFSPEYTVLGEHIDHSMHQEHGHQTQPVCDSFHNVLSHDEMRRNMLRRQVTCFMCLFVGKRREIVCIHVYRKRERDCLHSSHFELLVAAGC
jgi:hypothetical protein